MLHCEFNRYVQTSPAPFLLHFAQLFLDLHISTTNCPEYIRLYKLETCEKMSFTGYDRLRFLATILTFTLTPAPSDYVNDRLPGARARRIASHDATFYSFSHGTSQLTATLRTTPCRLRHARKCASRSRMATSKFHHVVEANG